MHSNIQNHIGTPQAEVGKSVIKNTALFLLLFFIFTIPWGNALYDGFTRHIGLGAFGSAGLLLLVHGTHKNYFVYHLATALFASWMISSVMWTPNMAKGMYDINTIVQLLLIPFLITLIIDSPKKILLAYQSYVLGVLIGSSIIISNYINGIESQYYGRYGIPNFEVDGLSIMLTIGIPIAAYLSTQYASKIIKMINVLIIPITIYAVFLTATRTASIVAVIGVMYWFFTHRKSSIRIKLTLVSIVIISVITVLSFAPQKSIDRLLSTGQSISSGDLNSRTVIWSASIEQWKQSPIIGNGLGGLGDVLGTLHVNYDTAHNTYIHILAENGLIGLALYLLIIFTLLFYIFQTRMDDKSFLLALLMVILVSQLTMHTHFFKETWYVFTMIAIHAHLVSQRVRQ